MNSKLKKTREFNKLECIYMYWVSNTRSVKQKWVANHNSPNSNSVACWSAILPIVNIICCHYDYNCIHTQQIIFVLKLFYFRLRKIWFKGKKRSDIFLWHVPEIHHHICTHFVPSNINFSHKISFKKTLILDTVALLDWCSVVGFVIAYLQLT